MKAAILMILYALGLAFAGFTAFGLAPEGANAITALAVPAVAGGLMVVCAVLSLRIKSNYKQGMIGIHIGLVLPLLYALAFGMRGSAASTASADYRELQSTFEQRLDEGSATTFRSFLIEQKYAAGVEDGSINGDETTLAQFRDKPGKLLDHDKAYLAATLWNLTAWSGFAFIAILLHRPKPPKPGEAGEQLDTSGKQEEDIFSASEGDDAKDS